MRIKNCILGCFLLVAGSLAAAPITFSPAIPAAWTKKAEQAMTADAKHPGNLVAYENAAKRESLLITAQVGPEATPARFEEDMKVWKQGVLDGQIHSRPDWKPENVVFGIIDNKGEKQAELSYQVTLATNQTRSDVAFFYCRCFSRNKTLVTIMTMGRDVNPKTDPELRKILDAVVVK